MNSWDCSAYGVASVTIENHATSFLSQKEVSYFYEQKCIKKKSSCFFFFFFAGDSTCALTLF